MLSARLLVACLVLLLALPSAASATFPGRNGQIFVTRDEFNRWVYVGRMTRVEPRTGLIRSVVDVCFKDPHYADTDSLSECTKNGGVAISPDGRSGVALLQESVYPRSPGVPHLLESLTTIDLRGGRATQVAITDPAVGIELVDGPPYPNYRRVRWSPDGESLLFDRPANPAGGHAVYVAPAADPNQRTFVTDGSQADWSSTGRMWSSATGTWPSGVWGRRSGASPCAGAHSRPGLLTGAGSRSRARTASSRSARPAARRGESDEARDTRRRGHRTGDRSLSSARSPVTTASTSTSTSSGCGTGRSDGSGSSRTGPRGRACLDGDGHRPRRGLPARMAGAPPRTSLDGWEWLGQDR